MKFLWQFPESRRSAPDHCSPKKLLRRTPQPDARVSLILSRPRLMPKSLPSDPAFRECARSASSNVFIFYFARVATTVLLLLIHEPRSQHSAEKFALTAENRGAIDI